MSDIVFSAADYDTLLAEAARLGFTQMDENGKEVIITSGPLKTGGSYLLNLVGEVFTPSGETSLSVEGFEVPVFEAQAGYWGRLRINGDASNLPEFSAAITQYKWSNAVGGWTADGVTLAPAWVATVGEIA